MSIIAQKWAYTQKVGNAVAKNILCFLASHNFAGDQSCFKVKTIMAATEYEESSVRRGLALLAEKKLITKQMRFGEKGQQLSNEYSLNIPQEYKDEFYEAYNEKPVDKVVKTGGGGVTETGGGCTTERGGVSQVHPLNNNINNNINNKSSYASHEQKSANQKKHDFAERPKTPLASVSNQTTSHDPNRIGRAVQASSYVEEHIKKMKEHHERNKLNSSISSNSESLQTHRPHDNHEARQDFTDSG